MRRPGRVLVATLAALLTTLLTTLVTTLGTTPAPARAEGADPFSRSTATSYQVTFAARACANYDEVMANQLRDDDAESPGRPGKDSAYTPGQGVDPKIEADVGCEPLVGAKFTLGGGREMKGSMTTVAAPAEPVSTVATVPRLDATGRSDGGLLPGAVTVTLTDDQITRAGRRELWAQGGAPGAPVPGGHSFAVLRCATDGRTGGNTQWIAFPAGVRHVFCFAYYVRGGAATGALTVKLRTTRPAGYPQRIPFESTLRRTGSFVLTADTAETTFVRRAGEANRLRPELPAGWRVASLTCAAAHATTDEGSGLADVTLNPAENASCAYAIDPPTAEPGLTIKVYAESAARFDITASGAGQEYRLTANARGDGSAATATGADLSTVAPGAYDLAVAPPAADAKQWSPAAASCNGTPVTMKGWALRAQLAAGASTECVVRVAHKEGAVTLRTVTTGAVGASGFALLPEADPAPGWTATATTAQPGSEVAATGDVPASLPFGKYIVLPLPPTSTVDTAWRMVALDCGNGGSTTSDAVARIELTPAAPTVTCHAAYQSVPHTRLRMSVRADGTTPAGGVGVDVECSDGSAGRAVLPGGTAGPMDLPQPLAFADQTTCTVSVPGTWEAPRSGSLVAEPSPAGASARPLPTTVALDQVGAEVGLTVVLVYDRTDHSNTVAGAFGSIRILPFALIGSGLVGLGAMVLLILIVRRHTNLD